MVLVLVMAKHPDSQIHPNSAVIDEDVLHFEVCLK